MVSVGAARVVTPSWRVPQWAAVAVVLAPAVQHPLCSNREFENRGPTIIKKMDSIGIQIQMEKIGSANLNE